MDIRAKSMKRKCVLSQLKTISLAPLNPCRTEANLSSSHSNGQKGTSFQTHPIIYCNLRIMTFF